ncbi:hypothetical protein RAAC3_TM7C00001G0363 [Candidatus Saccharibacteria bacterium RAAC3_TM7_1]|nr:hypothetical protein RAAC3_TM7C00001G0363 [Candidatus Saccharibacteria bacterium RAAC3_TM7_1]
MGEQLSIREIDEQLKQFLDEPLAEIALAGTVEL